MKKLLWIWLICLSGAHAQNIDIKSDRDAVIYLGEELSNIRGMLEIYAQIAGGVTYKMPKERLSLSLSRLDELLEKVESRYSNSPTIKETIKSTRGYWAPVKEVLEGAVASSIKRENMVAETLFVHNNIRKTIKGISAMKADVIAHSKIPHVKEINALLEIGASARRVSSHYMMKMIKVEDPTIKKHYENGIKIYKDSLQLLRNSKAVTQNNISSILDYFGKSLFYFEQIWNMQRFTPSLVVKKSNQVFEKSIMLISRMK